MKIVFVAFPYFSRVRMIFVNNLRQLCRHTRYDSGQKCTEFWKVGRLYSAHWTHSWFLSKLGKVLKCNFYNQISNLATTLIRLQLWEATVYILVLWRSLRHAICHGCMDIFRIKCKRILGKFLLWNYGALPKIVFCRILRSFSHTFSCP